MGIAFFMSLLRVGSVLVIGRYDWRRNHIFSVGNRGVLHFLSWGFGRNRRIGFISSFDGSIVRAEVGVVLAGVVWLGAFFGIITTEVYGRLIGIGEIRIFWIGAMRIGLWIGFWFWFRQLRGSLFIAALFDKFFETLHCALVIFFRNSFEQVFGNL